jgi:hypothetical protein
MNKELNIGANSKGVPRLWIEKGPLLVYGWRSGDRFDAIYTPSGGLLYIKNPQGKRKVHGTPDRPLIDTATKKLLPLRRRVSITFSVESIKVECCK